jgi:hypothetical protein
MLRCLYLICFVLMINLTVSRGATPVEKVLHKTALQIDTTTVQLRNFDNTALKKYSNQAAFKYNDSYAGPSLWSVFWRWFWNMVNAFLSQGNNRSIFTLFLKYLFIGLGLVALTFLILRLVGVDALNIFSRQSVTANLPYSESVENIHEINFDEGIDAAIAQHNYRFAVRLLYLKCLKQLSDSGQIRWEINKTNSNYVNELNNPEQRIAFNLLTRQFEYIWYGEFIIDEPVFKKINVLFNNFKGGYNERP